MAETFGQSFYIADTADTTDTRYDWGTGIAYSGNEVNTFRPRVRRFTISNDDTSIGITYRTDNSATAISHTLNAGETITHECISDALWIDAASGTPAFRAWGEG